MMAISASTAAAERGFSKMNLEKTSPCTRMGSKTLSNLKRIGVDGIPIKMFDSKAILKRWLKSGRRHVKGHKLRKPCQEEELSEFACTEEQFFVDLTK